MQGVVIADTVSNSRQTAGDVVDLNFGSMQLYTIPTKFQSQILGEQKVIEIH